MSADNHSLHRPVNQQQQWQQQTEKLQNLRSADSLHLHSVTCHPTQVNTSRLNPSHHHHHNQQQQQQIEKLQNLRSAGLIEKSRMENDQLLHPHNHNHHHHLKQQQHQQQERKQNSTLKNWTNSTAISTADFTHLAGDKLPQTVGVQTNGRPPRPLPTSLPPTLALTSPLSRTPTVGDGPPGVGVDDRMSMSMTGPPGQDSFVLSTLPRAAKFQTTRSTNGEVCQRQAVPSLPANQTSTTAFPTLQMPYVNGSSNWPVSRNFSKSKDTPFIRDRVHFFTRNELAAAVAANNFSDSGKTQTSSSSKTSWFRRALFK